MPGRDIPQPEERVAADFSIGNLGESPEARLIDRNQLLKNRLQTEADINAQRRWQKDGSAAERHMKVMLDRVAMGETIEYRALGLPETDAFLVDFIKATQDPAYIPANDWHQDVITKLRHYRAKEDDSETDVLKFLSGPDAPARMRLEFLEKEIRGYLEYTTKRDMDKLRELPPLPSPLPEEEGEEGGEASSPELPQSKQDKLRMSMDKLQELKEDEKPRGYFSVSPFFGGYVREQVYEHYEGGDQWGLNERRYDPAPNLQGVIKEERIYRGVVRGGAVTELPMYYGFVVDPLTLRASGEVKILIDEEGLYVIDARQAQDAVQFTVTIGQPKGWTVARNRVKSPENLAVEHPWLGDESRPAVRGLAGDTIQKSRLVKRFVRSTLEYSNDEGLNAVYAADPNGYFAAVEKHKKADCDVGNGYGVNVRSAGGIKARMVAGHYIKMKDAQGAAVMHSGSRHAWNEVWDEVGKEWMRFDDTPPGDPTLDEDPPDEKSEDDSGPGDYDEQEAKQMTEEELEKFRKKIEAAERLVAEANATPEERAAQDFAREAGCPPEQARSVRAKIEEARKLRDSNGRVIRDALADEFQTIVDTNLREVVEYRGPVVRSQGDEVDDKKMIMKDIHAGVADPLGYGREEVELKLAQEYGGMDVWMIFDRSGSMNEIDPLTNRSKKEEQQLAGFLALDGLSAFSYKTETAATQDLLISPLSVRSSVVAFQGGAADVLKPLSSKWKPKEQYGVWHGLESNVGGGTPAHLGLIKARAEIERIIAEEKRKPAPLYAKKRLRVVMVFMDGGADNAAVYLAEQRKLEEMEVYVSSWGMTESARAVEAYPEGHCVPSARQMIEPIAKHIVERAQALKLKQ